MLTRFRCTMRNAIISLIFLLISGAPTFAASTGDLKDSAPDRYIVIKGDTLWSISGRYLKEPWRWPELWKMNEDHIKNPHLIYPGDAIVLDRSSGQAQLRVEGRAGGAQSLETVRLSPRIRVEQMGPKPVPSIPPSVIEPFLAKPMVVGADELNTAARIVATQESRVALGMGNTAYAEGISKDKGAAWQVFRRGDPLTDPDTGEVLGYVALYLGDARVVDFGDVSKIEITTANQEIYRDDRLLPVGKQPAVFSYVPHAPKVSVRGRVISTYNNLFESGPRSIVALSKGSNDGLRVGTVLAVFRTQQDSRYALRTSPLWGEQGLGGPEPLQYRPEELTPRDAAVFHRPSPLNEEILAKLPDERYGLVMVFRTFDRAAFALVMEASRPVQLNDIVSNP